MIAIEHGLKAEMESSHVRPPWKAALRIIPIVFAGTLFLPRVVHSQQTVQDITCENGSGDYSARFFTGATVSVGPLRQGGFADRACAAQITWKGRVIPVASDAAQVGIDVLGADLGFGKPVVSFQIDKSGTGLRRSYEIYSLTKVPHLLYTLTGGGTYRAADTDLDGHIEIWTDDAAAVDGFEGVPSVDLDSPPTVVLRFRKGRLVNVGSESLGYYDAEITKFRSQLNQRDLAEFKLSDGKLSPNSLRSGQELHRLIRTKIAVLEIVWAYLYSGREQQAWSVLSEMWPSQDLQRIRAAMSTLEQRGILHSIERSGRQPRRGYQAKIYDTVNTTSVITVYDPFQGAPGPSQAQPTIVQPKSILLRRPPPSPDGSLPSANETIELVVDAAGKVHSAEVINGSDEPLIKASAGWQFIPAFRDGSPVACRFRLSLWTLK
jgi:hypothetical protein